MSDYEGMEEELTTDVIQQVAALTKQLDEADAEVTALEEKLKTAKNAKLLLERDTLPQFFKTRGLSKITLENGAEISVVEKVTCKQVEDLDRRKEGYAWLRTVGGEDLIKDNLIVEEVSDHLKAVLEENHILYDVRETVNTLTLNAFLTEKLGKKTAIASIEVEDVPKAFGLYVFDTTVIKRPK